MGGGPFFCLLKTSTASRRNAHFYENEHPVEAKTLFFVSHKMSTAPRRDATFYKNEHPVEAKTLFFVSGWGGWAVFLSFKNEHGVSTKHSFV